jgi:hypothetical protein
MDSPRIRRELSGSIRLVWHNERWLWSGVVAVLAGFALWVGATGAALNYGAEFAGQPLSVSAWSTTTTLVLGIVSVLWVVAPAALVTYLVDGYVTNVSGNVHTHYRVDHPSTLVVPVLALYAVGAGGAVAVGAVPAALAATLTAIGLLLLVRTLAYSYRVFSFSVPAVVQFSLFLSLAVTAVALLAGVATLAGRRAFVKDAAAGLGDVLGSATVTDALVGTTTVGPVTVSTLLGLAAALPAGLTLVYLLAQSLVGTVNRARKPDVPRSQLRTGQRYPEFARPVSASASDSPPAKGGPATDGTESASANTPTDTGSSEPATTAETGASTGAAAGDSDTQREDSADDVSHTKVFTAPDDGEFEADVPGVDGTPGASESDDETAVVGGRGGTPAGDGGYRCPTCDDSFDSDTNFAYCPTCGTELEPT